MIRFIFFLGVLSGATLYLDAAGHVQGDEGAFFLGALVIILPLSLILAWLFAPAKGR